MTPSRLVLRIVLVLALTGVGFFCYKSFVKRSPMYYSEQADIALRAGDRKSAVSFLRSWITDLGKRDPADPEIRRLTGEAHRRLGELFLAEAKSLGHADSYATNPFALMELEAAAEALPGDLELQKKYLKICLDIPYLESAAIAAARVIKLEPNNSDAVFALAWDAVDKLHGDADTYLKQLEKLDTTRKFQLIHLRYFLEMQTQHRDAQIQKLLDQAVELANTLDEKQVFAQNRFERDSMIKLLIYSITQSKDAKAAMARTESIIETCEKLADQETTAAAKLKDDAKGDDSLFRASDEKKPKKKPLTPSEAALAGVGYYANLVSQALLNLNTKYPVDPKNVTERANRDRLSERANRLRTAAIAAGQATPLVYHQAAMVMFIDGKTDDALALLSQAMDKGKKGDGNPKEYLELHLLAARQLIIARRFDLVEEHLKPLDADKDYEGWGQLLHGAVASARGAHEKARLYYERAQRQVGNTLLVHMALANTYLSLKEWDRALEHLQVLRDNVSRGNQEEDEWRRQQKATENQVHWGEFQAYLELNRVADAQKKLPALEKTEFGARAWAMMANYHLKQKDLASAMARLDDARTRFPGDLTIASLYVKMLNASGRGAEALAMIQKTAADAPKDLVTQLYYVRFITQQGKPNEAVDICDKLLTQFGDQPSIYVLKAQALLQADRPKEAEVVADKLATLKDGKNASSLLLFQKNLRDRDLPGAAKQLSDLQESLPDNGQLNVLRGQIELNRGNFATAAEFFGNALDVYDLRDKAGQGVLNSLVLLAQKEGPVKAEEQLGVLMTNNPDNKYLLIARAEMKFRQGQFDDGMRALDRMAQLNPADPMPHFLKAGGWWKRKRIDKAKEEIKIATQIDPKHLDSWALLADIQLGEKKYPQAIGAAEEGLKIDPKAMKLYLVQSEAYSKLGKVDAAVAAANKVLAEQPKNLLARKQLAQVYIDAGRIDDALKVYRDGRQLNHEGHSDLQSLTDVEFAFLAEEITLLSKNKRLDDAQKLVATAVGASPTATQSLQLAVAFLQAEQFAEAEKWGERALKLLPPNLQPQAHLILGRNAFKWASAEPSKEKLQKVREHYEAVLATNPRSYEAANTVAGLLATEFNDPPKALAIAETLRGEVAVDQLPLEFIDTLALCYTQANRASEAERLLSDVMRLHADDALLNYRLGTVYMALKKYASARNCFEKALRLSGLPEAKSLEAMKQLERLNALTSAPPAAAETPKNN